jgi:surfactin family lipopeptide synthetase A
MEEIFPCLIRGATLVLRTDAMLETMTGFLQTCRDWELTVLDLPTAYWHELTAQLAAESLALPSSVRLVIIGGERALRERLVMWHQQVGPHVRLVNTYGPTEVTVVATLCALSTQTGAALPQEVSIGGPLPGVQVYLLDRDRQPVPVGVVGEMYIGGMGVARGYLNRPELTAEKFLPDPFSNRRGARLYRTGDLARYQSDGRLVFLGRTDDQVKIRGYRFELGEIEAALGQHPAVHNAVVLAREDTPGDKRLVAYIVPTLGMSPTSSDLRRFLEAKLPAYMVPSAFVLLDSLPLTPNGKVDRRTLPAPEQARSEFEATFVAPHTSMEWLVAGVWQEVLRVERLSVYDNFFDIGGHSLTSIQAIARLAKRLGVRLSPRDLMVQTLGQLASTCEARLSLSQPPKAPSVTLRVWRAMKNMVWGRREERS